MPRYVVVTDASRFDVSTRPAMPGLGIAISHVQGQFDVALGPDGDLDPNGSIDGALSLLIEDQQTANPLITTALRGWLRGDQQAAVTVTITGLRSRADGRHDVLMTVVVRDRTVNLVGTGRIRPRPDGTVEAAGLTLCDPRAFGISLPSMLNLVANVRWQLVLEPLPE